MSPLRRMFAVVALALILAPLVARAPLFDPDEGLHAAIAQEMLQRGDYVTPTFRGEPFLDKPILFFWAEAASLTLFGHHEAAVRIPPLLFGLFGMVTVALLGRALFGESAGLIAGIAYGTMLVPMGVSEVAVHDIGLVPFMCIAALCLVRADALPHARTTSAASSVPSSGRAASPSSTPEASAVRRKVWTYGVIAGVALGLSILTKGLVGIVFAGILTVCLTVHRPTAWMRLAIVLIVAVVVAGLVAAPWYFAMERAHPGYLHYYFVERHLQGYLTATQRHAGRPFWYYVPIVVGGALPWTAYLAGAARSALRAGTRPRADSLRLVLWGWFAAGFVFLSAGESKLITYALPLFPVLALIVGEHLDHVLHSPLVQARGPLPPPPAPGRRQWRDGWFKSAFAVHVAALALFPVIGLVLLDVKFGEVQPFRWAGLLVLALAILGAGRHALRSGTSNRLLQGIVGMTVLATVGLMTVAPRAAAWMTGRDLAAALNGAGALPPRVWVVNERIGSLIFYLDPALRAEAGADRVSAASFAEAIARSRIDPPEAMVAVRNNHLPRFYRMFSSPPAPDARAGTFSLFRAGTLRAATGTR